LNRHGSDSEIASFHLIGKLMAIACQAASRLLPERQMIDLEANQRQKIFELVSTLRLLPTFVFAEDVRMDREFTGFRLFEGLGKIAKLP
jgi:hypothetical protein